MLDLTERQLPMLKLDSPPELVTFAAYTSAQLIAILEQRLSSECLDRKAIELCARKVSALTGDVRRALDIASQMLANLDTLSEEETDKENVLLISSRTPMKTPPRLAKPEGTPMKLKRVHSGVDGPALGETTPKRPVNDGSACREVLKAINKTMSSPCQRSRLPAQTRTLLATLMRLVSSSSSSSVNLKSVFRTPSKTTASKEQQSECVFRDRLFSAYVCVCEYLRLQAPCSDEVDEMLTLLESQSMVKLVRNGAKGDRVFFTVEMGIARQQINDNALISEIEKLDLPCC